MMYSVRSVHFPVGSADGWRWLNFHCLMQTSCCWTSRPTTLIYNTQEVLESVLSNFSGTILLVSHDRYLIDSLATQIWEVDPQGRTLHVFKGSYTEYKAQQMKQAEQQLVGTCSGIATQTCSTKISGKVREETAFEI